ncbi:MAG: methyltransferase domain-containing protein [Desulfobaccales bacterium]
MTHVDFLRYLRAKVTVDDRSLNRPVFDALARLLLPPQESRSLTVLEVGCGLGSMAARLTDWGLFRRVRYLGVDVDPACVAAAREGLPGWARERDLGVSYTDRGDLVLSGPGRHLELAFRVGDAREFLRNPALAGACDLVLAHAFLDLLPLEETVRLLLACLAPGGAFYLTLNFDGTTIFWPPLDPELDERVTSLYHLSMDERRLAGLPTGGSQTGRQLFGLLPAAGGRILAAGGSEWVVFTGSQGYPAEEGYFLRCILAMVEESLSGRLPAEELDYWLARRRRQLKAGELVFLARHLDFCGVKD